MVVVLHSSFAFLLAEEVEEEARLYTATGCPCAIGFFFLFVALCGSSPRLVKTKMSPKYRRRAKA